MPQTSPDKKITWEKIIFFLTPISTAQKIFLINNLRVMVKAGLSIVDALRILAAQTANKKLKKMLEEIGAEVNKGQALSETLAKFPKLFPEIYVKMIAAGEVSGTLDESLAEITEQMKKNYAMNSKIRGAMIYPAVIVTAVVGVGVEMIVFVLPKLLNLFTELNAQLPLSTRILIVVSNFLINYGFWLIIALIAALIGFIYLKKRPKIKRSLHGLILRLPIFGRIAQQINLARFTITLSSLLKSAISIVEALDITAAVLNNLHYKQAILEAGKKVKTGQGLSESLEKYPRLFPPLVTQMILVGEKSGTTEDLLNELAVYYTDEVDQTLKNISTIIEPVLMIFLGVAVAGLAVAVIMPMYSLSQGI